MPQKRELGNRLVFPNSSYTKLCYKAGLCLWHLALLADYCEVLRRTGLLFLSIHNPYSPLCSTTSFHCFGEPHGHPFWREGAFFMYYSTNSDPMQIFFQNVSRFFLIILMSSCEINPQIFIYFTATCQVTP